MALVICEAQRLQRRTTETELSTEGPKEGLEGGPDAEEPGPGFDSDARISA